MSNYVPNQDLFSEFTHEGDWLRDVHGADGTWTNGIHFEEPLLPFVGCGPFSYTPVPQSLGTDGTPQNTDFPLDQFGIPFSEELKLRPFDEDDYGTLLDDSYLELGNSGHDTSSVPTQRSSNAMVNQASETQTMGLEDQDTASGHSDPSLPTKPSRTGLVDRTKARTTRKKDVYNTNLFCDFPGCPNREAFRRPFELNRHMSKHTRDISYTCPVVACNRSGHRAFYREDKLKAHLRSVHDDAERSSCPVPSCSKEPLQLDLLRVHMRIHNDDEASEVPLLKLYAVETRQCPLENCRIGSSRWMSSDKIPGPNGHLLVHDQAERQEQRVGISARGYDAASGSIVCPICRQLCPGSGEFRRHLSDVHMTVTEHARLYTVAVRSITNSYEKCAGWSIWDDLPFVFFQEWVSSEESLRCGFKCPGCSVTIADRPGHFGDRAVNHPGLIVATEELYRHRREILRLLPDFYAHPVFDDVRRTW